MGGGENISLDDFHPTPSLNPTPHNTQRGSLGANCGVGAKPRTLLWRRAKAPRVCSQEADKKSFSSGLGTEVEAMGGGDSNHSDGVSLEEESVEAPLSNSQTKNTQNELLSANGGLDAHSKWLLAIRAAKSETLRLSRAKAFKEIMQSYDSLKVRSSSLEEAKRKIISYKPGTWTEAVAGLTKDDYAVPETTTLLLVGLSRSGKSSLVNRISRVFEDKFTPERAQVSYNCVGDGTTFLHEYMIPRGSTSFCLYDTCGFDEDLLNNIDMIKTWMTKGVRHGELVFRDTDNSNQRNSARCEAWQSLCSRERRPVNFVIFVVDARSILTFMNLEDVMERDEDDLFEDDIIKDCFSCPYLSCKDDKPVVVCTHGDLLSHVDRARVRIHLGELLGISPVKQVFDIPENCDPETDLAVVDMLTYSLMHADKNFPIKSCSPYKLGGLGEVLEDFLFGVDEDIEEDNREDDGEMESSLVSKGAKKVTSCILRPAMALQMVLGAMLIALMLICTCLFAFASACLVVKLIGGHAIWNFWCSSKNNSQCAMNLNSIPNVDSAELHINWHKIRHLWGA